jgi:hypothetical protein
LVNVIWNNLTLEGRPMLIRFENSDDVSNVSIDGNIYAGPIFP